MYVWMQLLSWNIDVIKNMLHTIFLNDNFLLIGTQNSLKEICNLAKDRSDLHRYQLD